MLPSLSEGFVTAGQPIMSEGTGELTASALLPPSVPGAPVPPPNAPTRPGSEPGTAGGHSPRGAGRGGERCWQPAAGSGRILRGPGLRGHTATGSGGHLGRNVSGCERRRAGCRPAGRPTPPSGTGAAGARPRRSVLTPCGGRKPGSAASPASRERVRHRGTAPAPRSAGQPPNAACASPSSFRKGRASRDSRRAEATLAGASRAGEVGAAMFSEGSVRRAGALGCPAR